MRGLLSAGGTGRRTGCGTGPVHRGVRFSSFVGLSVHIKAILRYAGIPGTSGLLRFHVSSNLRGHAVISNVTRRCGPRSLINGRIYFVTGLTPHGLGNVISRKVVLSTRGFSNGLTIVAPRGRMGPNDRIGWSNWSFIMIAGSWLVKGRVVWY